MNVNTDLRMSGDMFLNRNKHHYSFTFHSKNTDKIKYTQYINYSVSSYILGLYWTYFFLSRIHVYGI